MSHAATIAVLCLGAVWLVLGVWARGYWTAYSIYRWPTLWRPIRDRLVYPFDILFGPFQFVGSYMAFDLRGQIGSDYLKHGWRL